ncbi:MAG TPA: M13 family metallopeptidase [Thermoanaerobaculia bacterium]|nr:M13 family metallopeptidase [Thermoanaerobaculia bacterium]
MKRLVAAGGVAMVAVAFLGGPSGCPRAWAAAAAPASSAPGVDLAAMDRRVEPCVDFYTYACGGWLAKNPVPPDRSSWSRFAELAQRNREKLRAILEANAADRPRRAPGAALAAEAPADADRRKLGDFYATCMDEAGVAARGIAPIQPDLDRIAALKSTSELPALAAHLRTVGVGALFGFRSGQDAKDATSVIAMVDAGGLALPDRDYYLQTDAKSAEQRRQYAEHVQRMFALLGEPAERAAADAASVLAIETSLAKASLDRVSRRDPNKVYHKLTRQQLAALTPAFSWDAFLAAIDVPPVANLNVSEPDFLQSLEGLLRSTGVDAWKAYLRWHLLHATAEWLPGRFVDEDFAFYGKVLRGSKQILPRWERCVDSTDRALGEALGREYVAASFEPEAKRRALALVGETEKAMARDISGLPWMGAETKKRAQEKLAAIANKIGYPERWKDYSRLEVVRGDLVGNVERANACELARRLAKIGKPVDRREWNMTPPTVNAYYNASMNDINFPAGILQPPFYDARRDDAANYGAIGAVIGHEMTHGFDDHGREFDGRGNLTDWWSPADAAEFQRRATCLADEYSSFPAGGLKVNGRLTLGENTADNGGLRVAYMAYEDSQAGKPRQALDGFSPEQRLFLGFAQVWCESSTPEGERLRVLTNPHSPGRYRTNGTVVNMPQFQDAFQCKPGSPMAPENRCRVW